MVDTTMRTKLLAHIERCYGLRGELTNLASYADKNYLLSCTNGRRYIVKLSQQRSIPSEVEVMVALAAKSSSLPFAIPLHIKRLDHQYVGTLNVNGESWYARIINFLPGISWAACRQASASRLYAMGQGLAMLDGLLAPMSWREEAHLWDLAATYKSLPDHPLFLQLSPEWQQKARQSVDFVKAHEHHLPRQLIHNDANDHNIFLDNGYAQRPAALIDFGDLCYSFRVNEIAIAAVYLTDTGVDFYSALQSFIQGYGQSVSLSRAELACLPHLMRLRIIQSRMNYLASCGNANEDAYLAISQRQLERQFVRLDQLDYPFTRK